MSRIVLILAASAACCSAQWVNDPTPGIPRTSDGKPNLSAPRRQFGRALSGGVE
jgi:hypothetical protein